jgi:hypothetical protein
MCGIHGPGNPEVDHSRPVRRQQHVRRLQVPVHHSGGMNRIQPLRQPSCQGQHRGHRQRPVLIHRLSQRRPVHKAGHQPGQRRRGVGIDHRSGEQTADPARCGDLPDKPGPEPRIAGQLVPDDLHGHQSPAR